MKETNVEEIRRIPLSHKSTNTILIALIGAVASVIVAWFTIPPGKPVVPDRFYGWQGDELNASLKSAQSSIHALQFEIESLRINTQICAEFRKEHIRDFRLLRDKVHEYQARTIAREEAQNTLIKDCMERTQK